MKIIYPSKISHISKAKIGLFAMKKSHQNVLCIFIFLQNCTVLEEVTWKNILANVSRIENFVNRAWTLDIFLFFGTYGTFPMQKKTSYVKNNKQVTPFPPVCHMVNSTTVKLKFWKFFPGNGHASLWISLKSYLVAFYNSLAAKVTKTEGKITFNYAIRLRWFTLMASNS